MPLVDAISWHPMYGTSPEHQSEYYYNYPSLVQEIKDVASAHGFDGEYIVEELSWDTARAGADAELIHSESVAAKYYARGVMMHLGMDIIAGYSGDPGADLHLPMMRVIRNLCTVMAGTEPVSLPVEIQSEETNIRSYSYSFSNGDNLIALWTDGLAVDVDPGVKTNVTIRGMYTQNVMGIDVLNGFEQPMVVSIEDGNLTINNMIVRDYPLILHITKPN
jgi:hypothetical protein